MFKIDIYKIVDKFNLNSSEEKILTYIIDNIDNVKDIGVRGIAKEHYTSTTTIMNLAKKLGYDGFLDMYYNLFFTLRSKKTYFLQESEDKYFRTDMDEILSLVEKKDILAFVDLLFKYKNEIIYTYAVGLSKSVILYITQRLLLMGFKCIFTDAYESYDVNNIDAKIAIIFSKSGETDSAIKVCNLAQKVGIKTVSITGELENTVAKLSTINFRIYDMNSMDDRNKLPTSFYANTIMLFEFLMSKYLEKINMIER